METPLQIRFTPDKNDYIHASRALASKTPTFIVMAVIIGLIMVSAVLVLLFPDFGDGNFTSAALVTLLVGGFYVLYYLFLIPWQLARTFKKDVYLQKERIFTFFDAHVTMQVEDKSSDLVWENFEKVVEGKVLYLLIYKADQRVYPFIPKRAFSDPAAEEAFKEILAEKSVPLK